MEQNPLCEPKRIVKSENLQFRIPIEAMPLDSSHIEIVFVDSDGNDRIKHYIRNPRHQSESFPPLLEPQKETLCKMTNEL